MEYDNETIPGVVGAVPGDASPAVLYKPKFTVLNIQQVVFILIESAKQTSNILSINMIKKISAILVVV